MGFSSIFLTLTVDRGIAKNENNKIYEIVTKSETYIRVKKSARSNKTVTIPAASHQTFYDSHVTDFVLHTVVVRRIVVAKICPGRGEADDDDPPTEAPESDPSALFRSSPAPCECITVFPTATTRKSYRATPLKLNPSTCTHTSPMYIPNAVYNCVRSNRIVLSQSACAPVTPRGGLYAHCRSSALGKRTASEEPRAMGVRRLESRMALTVFSAPFRDASE